MGSVTSSGLGSGLDVTSIISQLMTIEKQPLIALNKEESSINAKISSFGKIQNTLATLRDKSAAFNSSELWGKTSTTLSDASVATVTSISGKSGATGSYSLQVDALASAQTVSSTAFASSASQLSEGTLTIDIGSWTGGAPPTAFTSKTGTSGITISIGSGDVSLGSIRDKINAAAAGVTAGIVTDASGSRLTLRSTATGAENAFRVSVNETNDDGNAATGLSALAFDATSTASPMALSQRARNASAVVNGISVTSASNTLDGVVEGVSIKLNKTTTSPIEMTVAADFTDVKARINDFMSAYNGMVDQIKTETKYDAATKTAGKLQSDRTAIGLLNKMQSLLHDNFTGTGSGSLSRLSDIGLSLNATGRLELKSSKLDDALANPSQVKALLNGGGTGDSTAMTGFAKRFRAFADAAQGTDGPMETRTAGLKSQLRRVTDRQDALDVRYQGIEARLRKQYDALDQRMSNITATSNSVNLMIKQLYG
ncbi:flagellar filament capping protein FliD [uncultured Sphaerotilus sp.]|uniref:flagellar filament capping protein FliD n=1 Tax=uncultured Sphaerotilus sp. TaxID=474984 RepID=UPI0030CA4077